MVSADLLQELTSLWFQAPMVISSRLQDMAVPAFGGDPSEINLMLSEKMSAAVESLLAVNMALMNEGVIATAAIATGTCAGLAGGADRLAVAALKPYGKRVRANARRLSE